MTLIGIDVGWSKDRSTCGIAVADPELPFPEDRRRRLEIEGGRIRARRFKMCELVEVLKNWSDHYRQHLANAVVVIDGPIGPVEPPAADRLVDKQCATGPFQGWAQPMPVSHKSSEKFIGATYELLGALAPWQACISGKTPRPGIIVIETNPTVALAVMMPRVPLNHIASRGRPLLHRGEFIGAKSDWYWRNGAGRQVARALALGDACAQIAHETDHELCAALTCLALAHQFANCACDRSGAIALGDENGIYLLPAEIDRTWEAGFYSPLHGKCRFGDHSAQCDGSWGAATPQ
jgi:hypothetical protein